MSSHGTGRPFAVADVACGGLTGGINAPSRLKSASTRASTRGASKGSVVVSALMKQGLLLALGARGQGARTHAVMSWNAAC
jgi:hypothetical protein